MKRSSDQDGRPRRVAMTVDAMSNLQSAGIQRRIQDYSNATTAEILYRLNRANHRVLLSPETAAVGVYLQGLRDTKAWIKGKEDVLLHQGQFQESLASAKIRLPESSFVSSGFFSNPMHIEVRYAAWNKFLRTEYDMTDEQQAAKLVEFRHRVESQGHLSDKSGRWRLVDFSPEPGFNVERDYAAERTEGPDVFRFMATQWTSNCSGGHSMSDVSAMEVVLQLLSIFNDEDTDDLYSTSYSMFVAPPFFQLILDVYGHAAWVLVAWAAALYEELWKVLRMPRTSRGNLQICRDQADALYSAYEYGQFFPTMETTIADANAKWERLAEAKQDWGDDDRQLWPEHFWQVGGGLYGGRTQ